jgi:asparagine synthase (glutamine-hydrolysing)
VRHCWNLDSRGARSIDGHVLRRMNESQRHRGPDETGTHFAPGIALGHKRLSIIDLKTGQQPLFNEDGSVVIVFNGEIYNYRELIPELVALGHVFRTRSDTEVIVHAWESWGERCVDRLRGMFAFALWDEGRQTLFLARDRLGVKPLFLRAFAWRPLAVRLGAEIPPRARRIAARTRSAGRSKSISRSAMCPNRARSTLRRSSSRRGTRCACGAANPPQSPAVTGTFASPGTTRSRRDAQLELTERIRESVGLRMISEVPLGAFLSGGVDSSAVVAMMAGQSAEPVNTCSISFDDPAYDETRFAQQVADRYHTRHVVEHVNPDDFDLIDTLAALYDEPFADSSAIPTYRVCQLARRHVTVALSGDAGDENMGGYRRYLFQLHEERLRSLLPRGIRRPVFGALGRLYPKLDWAPRVFRAKSTFLALARDSVDGYFHSISVFRDDLRRRLYSPEFKRRLAGYSASEVFHRHAQRAGTDDPLALIQYIDLQTYLVGDINTKVDRASMAHALEVREPLMDHPLVEWLATLPSNLKVRGGEGKWILKKAMEPHLPHNIMYRPKMGFAVPLARWFRGPLRDRVHNAVLHGELARTGFFDRTCLQRLVDEHTSGRRDHSQPLWSLMMFEAFLRKVDAAGTGESDQPVGVERKLARVA